MGMNELSITLQAEYVGVVAVVALLTAAMWLVRYAHDTWRVGMSCNNAGVVAESLVFYLLLGIVGIITLATGVVTYQESRTVASMVEFLIGRPWLCIAVVVAALVVQNALWRLQRWAHVMDW